MTSSNTPPARRPRPLKLLALRLSRRFYSPILLSEAYADDLRLCAPRRNLGPPPSAMRPCAGSRWRGDARTGTDGGARRLRLHAPIRAFLALDLRRSRCLLTVAVFLAAGFWLGFLGAEGVGDALVGGVGLPVDAVRVDLQQDGYDVPGAAGDLGRGQDHGECRLDKAAAVARDRLVIATISDRLRTLRSGEYTHVAAPEPI
jgi:hypothetical protein